MSKIGKPYERPLSPELAAEILNIPFEDPSVGEPPSTIGGHVRRATAAVGAANAMLSTSSVAQIIARSLMRDLKKRGTPSLYVTPEGLVMLSISYDQSLESPKDLEIPVVRPAGESDLPKLAVLRVQAKQLGVDISGLGRQRRAIYNLIRAAQTSLEAGVDEVRVTTAPKGSLGNSPK